MILGGYGKLTLQDFPGRIAAICFTIGCSLRCPYCHNGQLALGKGCLKEQAVEDMTSSFLDYLQKRKGQLDGVVVSGGEPLQHPEIAEFLNEIRFLGLEVKLDTNGMYPERLKDLIDQGLVQYVAMDYKNSKKNLPRTIGLTKPEERRLTNAYYDNWKKCLRYLRRKKIPYELRTTVVREMHSRDTLVDMAQSLKSENIGRETWYLQQYANTGSVLNNRTKTEAILTAYSNEEMKMMQGALLPYAPGILVR